MRFRDALVPLIAISLPLAACGEPQSIDEAKVSGFDHTLVVNYEETMWEHVGDAAYPPNYSDSVRNVRSRQVKGECREVDDPFFSEDSNGITGDAPDNSDCLGDFWCSTEPGDPTHCEKEPDETRWEYDEKVWRNIGTCALEPMAFEVKREEPRRPEDCIKVFEALKPEGERRSFQEQRFIVRASVRDDEDKLHYSLVEIPEETWAVIKRDDCIEVRGPKSKPEARSFVKVC